MAADSHTTWDNSWVMRKKGHWDSQCWDFVSEASSPAASSDATPRCLVCNNQKECTYLGPVDENWLAKILQQIACGGGEKVSCWLATLFKMEPEAGIQKFLPAVSYVHVRATANCNEKSQFKLTCYSSALTFCNNRVMCHWRRAKLGVKLRITVKPVLTDHWH